MRHLSALFLLAATLPLGGCFSSSTLVKVRPDGSGTIEQSILMNVKAFEGMAGMLGAAPGEVQTSGKMPTVEELLDEARLKTYASELGTGVRYVSSAPLTQGPMQGGRVTYAFDDINAVLVRQGPANAPTASSEEPIRFTFTRAGAGPATLTLTMAGPDRNATAPEASETPKMPGDEDVPPEMMAMLKGMLAGLHIGVDVEVEGRIVKSTSPYVSGSRVTILQLDMDQLLAQQEALKKLPTLGPGASVAELQAAFKGIEGMKVAESPVTIQFQ